MAKLMNGAVVVAESDRFTYDESQKAWFDGKACLYVDIDRAMTVIDVPHSVTRRQALQQLRLEGITEAQIETQIMALPITDLQKDLALIELRESQFFERNRPLVATLAAMLGKDDAQADEMFINASRL